MGRVFFADPVLLQAASRACTQLLAGDSSAWQRYVDGLQSTIAAAPGSPEPDSRPESDGFNPHADWEVVEGLIECATSAGVVRQVGPRDLASLADNQLPTMVVGSLPLLPTCGWQMLGSYAAAYSVIEFSVEPLSDAEGFSRWESVLMDTRMEYWQGVSRDPKGRPVFSRVADSTLPMRYGSTSPEGTAAYGCLGMVLPEGSTSLRILPLALFW